MPDRWWARHRAELVVSHTVDPRTIGRGRRRAALEALCGLPLDPPMTRAPVPSTPVVHVCASCERIYRARFGQAPPPPEPEVIEEPRPYYLPPLEPLEKPQPKRGGLLERLRKAREERD